MSKKQPKVFKGIIKLVINAGQAKPAPPVGPALGQAGLNIMTFCKEFNAKTADVKEDVPIPVTITTYTDKSYDYVMKTPPTSYFVKKALSLESASQKPGHSSAGQISLQQIYEIAKVKQQDQPFKSLEAVCRSVIGVCQGMGIQVEKPDIVPPPATAPAAPL